MSDPRTDIARKLLDAELRRIVADAKRSGGMVYPREHALGLLMAFPSTHYSLERIVEEMVLIAKNADERIELDRKEDLSR